MVTDREKGFRQSDLSKKKNSKFDMTQSNIKIEETACKVVTCHQTEGKHLGFHLSHLLVPMVPVLTGRG